MTSAERIAYLHEEAMKLSVAERRDFVRALTASFDGDADDDGDDELHPAWRPLIEGRVAAIRDGTARSIPASEAIAALRAGLK